ncbi:MAG: hypothetical protein J5602_03590 [Clostridia bacterium]|nr:hypothetical protein [Clostridia bacterium]
MKRFIITLLAVLLLPAYANAEGFVLEENKILAGMNQSWRQGYEPTVSDGAVNIYLPLTSDKTGGKITATLELDDPDTSPFASENLSADCWKNEGLYAVRLRLPLVSARHNGDYAARVVVEGTDRDGNPMRSEYPTVVRIRDGRSDLIRPGISAVSADLNVGEDGAIRALVTNTSRYAEMKDIILTVTDAAGDVLPAGSDKLAVPALMPGESAWIEYPATVKPDAAVALHTLAFRLSYTALDQPGEWEETFTLPVSQEIRLEQGGVQAPPSVIQGDAAAFALPLMNLGRGELRNVVASLSLPGVVERQSVLVGAIAPGETKQAKISVTPGKDILGELSGEISVAAEDAWGNETGFSLPVALTVEAAPEAKKEAETAADLVKEMVPGYVWPLAGACLTLLIALIVQGALLRGKIRRMEEEKL